MMPAAKGRLVALFGCLIHAKGWLLVPPSVLRGRPLRRCSVTGHEEHPPALSWEAASGGQMPAWLTNRARELGFAGPVRVQAATLPTLVNGSDVVVQAQTGSGKTLAYLMPLLAAIDSSSVTTQAIVVVPTRELGLQVSSVARQLAAGGGSGGSSASGGEGGGVHGSNGSARYVDGGDDDGNDDDNDDDDDDDSIAPGTARRGPSRILVMSLLEGSRNRRQRAWAWAEPPHVVVANPVTLEKMLATGGLRVNNLRFLVVDEVDACADMGSPNGLALHNILGKHLSPSFGDTAVAGGTDSDQQQQQQGFAPSASPSAKIQRRQSVFLSASVPQPRHFLRQCVQRRWCLQERPVWINVNADDDTVKTPPQIEHWYLVTTMEKKFGSLRGYLRREVASNRLKRAIVFVNPGRPLEQMAVALDRDLMPHMAAETPTVGDPKERRRGGGDDDDDDDDGDGNEDSGDGGSLVGILAENKGLNKRASVMGGFRDGDHRILLATDMAARGLDVPETSHVILFDMPPTAETYLHRAGRTGRMGRPGVVVTLASRQEVFVIERLGNSLSIAIAPVE